MNKLILTCYLIFIGFFVTPTHAQIVSTQDSVDLAKLCYALGGLTAANGGLPTGWNASLPITSQWRSFNPVCRWHGIDTVVLGSIYRVRSVNLSNIGLYTGGITMTVSNFTGPAPLAYMDFLEELILNNCGLNAFFTNEGFFSNSAINMPAFQRLDISNNNFYYDTTFFNIAIGGLTSLRELNAEACFDSNSVNAYVGVAILKLGTNFSNLTHLNVASNRLQGTVPNLGIGPFENLQTAILANNRFSSAAIPSTNFSMSSIDISYNRFQTIDVIQRYFDAFPNLGALSAVSALNTATGPYFFNYTGFNVGTSTPKYINISENNISGPLDLTKFGNASKTLSLEASYNQFDTILFSNTNQTFLRVLSIHSNNTAQRLTSMLPLFMNYPALEELYLNSNRIHGRFPAPDNGFQAYNTPNLKRIIMFDNPDIDGALNLNWFIDNQPTPSPLEKLEIQGCNLRDIDAIPNANNFPNLQYVWVDENSLHFDDLYRLVNYFGFSNIPVYNNTPNGIPSTHYIPPFWNAAGSTFDSLYVFTYWPQDTAGIGGVRRRPQGDSVFFATTVGEPAVFRKNDVTWIRYNPLTTGEDTIATVNTVSQGAAGTTITSTFGAGVANAGAYSANQTNAMAIYQLDTAAHSHHIYYATVRNDSFPFLEIPVKPKKLVVGQCYDALNRPTLCQQIVVQYQAVVADSAKTALREEFGISVIDSCVCGSIELWSMPDTLNQVEVEQFGTGTQSSASRASTKAELLSADQNYPLLTGTTSTITQAPNFTQGTSNPNPTLVAIIDSGMDFDNPKLQKRVWVKPSESTTNNMDDDNDCEIDNAWGWNYLERSNNTSDDHGHGTGVASIVGGYSSVNVLPNNSDNDEVAIVPYKYTNAAGQGTVFHAACALRHAADYRDSLSGGQVARVRVINTSWGYYGAPCIVLENAILYAGDQCDVLIVASAGNDGVNTALDSTTRHWPSNSPFVPTGHGPFVDNVISVAALGSSPDFLASYSNWGPIHIDIAAEGTTNTYALGGDTSNLVSQSGTSFSAPQVARAAAMLFDEFPSATAGAVKNALILGVDTLQSIDRFKLSSGGRLNYTKARQILMNTINPTLCASNGFVVAVDRVEASSDNNLARVYPNPFQSALRIDFNDGLLNLQEEITIRMTAVDGKLISQYRVDHQSTFEIPVSDLPAGLYFIQIGQQGRKQIQKVVKF